MAMTVERKVGLFFIVALIILGTLLEVGEKWNPFQRTVTYRTFLTTVTGLKVGDPVRLAGVDVGRIKDIVVHDSNVELVFNVKPDTKIKKDTVASLRLTNLLGGQFLSLSFGTPSSPNLGPGGTVIGQDSANIDEIVNSASDLVKSSKDLIASINQNQNEVMHKISAILDDNRVNLRDSIANFRSITAKIDSGSGSLAMLLNDGSLYNNTRDAVTSLKSVAGKIDTGTGTIGKLVNDPTLYNDAKDTLASLKTGVANMNSGFADFKEIAGKVNRGEGTIGKLINDDAMYADLKDATKNIDEITKKINTGQGTLGKLVNEDNLYRDTTAAMKKVEKAAESLSDSGPISVIGSIVGTLF